jgi:hypothetical protein
MFSKYMRFEVFMVVTILMMFFWVWASCGLAGRSQHFRKAYCLHLQGSSDHAGNQRDYIGWQERKSEGKGQSGRCKVEIEAGPMGGLQAGVSGGGLGRVREMKSAVFEAHRMG